MPWTMQGAIHILLSVCGAPWFWACTTCTEEEGRGVQTEGGAAPQQPRLGWLQWGMETEPHSD